MKTVNIVTTDLSVISPEPSAEAMRRARAIMEKLEADLLRQMIGPVPPWPPVEPEPPVWRAGLINDLLA